MVNKLFTNLCKNVVTQFAILSGAALCLMSPGAASAVQSTSVTWNPSTDPTVAGYAIYYGNQSGTYPYRIDVGTNTITPINNLQEGQTNFFVVTAYNAAGVESLPSNEISYIVPGLMKMNSPVNAGDPVSLSFPVAPGHNYSVQASVDLQTWSTVWQTTGATNGWVNFQDTDGSNLQQRFYRLAMN